MSVVMPVGIGAAPVLGRGVQEGQRETHPGALPQRHHLPVKAGLLPGSPCSTVL
jgi:hypothetical protein